MIDIRRATTADAPGIARVHQRSHIETYMPIFGGDYSGPSLAERELHWRTRLQASDLAFVAVADGEIIGFTHALETEDGGALLTTLYLLAKWHRQGIGRDLFSHIRALMHERGHAAMRFGVLPTNAAAIAFYQSQGARPLGHVVSDHGGEPHDDILFEIKTGPY
ncbi:N-acetyltransferase family protein [Dongia sp.]|uniref:GNAT family N-acetyltransferase n=1 Tax=Dongia sp. TaxID=1977262 RepID=UPI0035B2071C